MKNLRLTHILTAMVFILPTAVHGAQICGRISGSVIHTPDGQGYMGLKGGTHTGASWEAVELNNAFDYVCLNYTADISTSEDLDLFHHYLSYSSVETNTYACAKEKRYSSSGCVACDNGYASETDNHKKTTCTMTPPPIIQCPPTQYFTPAGCQTCPSGSLGADPMMLIPGQYHSNIVCDYCAPGYYWPGGAAIFCEPCPAMPGATQAVPSPTPSLTVKYRRPITECCEPANKEFTDSSGTYTLSDTCCYSE